MERELLTREIQHLDYFNVGLLPSGAFIIPNLIAHIPPKLYEETTNGYTCYVAIDLDVKANKNNKAYKVDKNFTPTAWVVDFPEQKTAIYVPSSFKPEAEADIILYLHGHLTLAPGLIVADKKKGTYNSPSIQQYLNYPSPKSDPYFGFREIVNASGKNVVFVAPTLGPRSQYGNLVSSFDNYMDQVVAAVNEYTFKARNVEGKLKLRSLVIAAHSGGGSPMLNIALQSKSTYKKLIKSCWGFDSWYNKWCVKKDKDNKCIKYEIPWNDIAKSNMLSIYAYWYNSRAVPAAIKDKVIVVSAASDKALVAKTGKGKDLHFPLLPHYFKERIDNL